MITLLSILQIAFCSVHIISPSSLRDEYPKGLDSVLGDFGKPPYSTKISGVLLYLSSNRNGCSPITDLPQDTDHNEVILMFDRGNCSFVLKVKHAQDVGIKAVIIANNVPDEPNIAMQNNGLGGEIYIPAFMITKKDADRLKSIYSETSISLLLSFEIPNSPDKINLSLVLSSGNEQSQDFIQKFYSIGQLLTSQVVDLEVHYTVFQCLKCKNEKFSTAEANCMGGGRYCAPDPDDRINGPLTGRDVIQEDLRQMCLLETVQKEKEINYAKFFEFHKEFVTKCRTSFGDPECSEGIMKKLGFDVEAVKWCVKDSYEEGSVFLAENKKLAAETEYWRNNGLHSYPAVLINHQAIVDLENTNLLEKICSGYYSKNVPAFCDKGRERGVEESEGVSMAAVVCGLILFFGVLVAILLIYRHTAKKDMQKEMRRQVNSAVSQYFALSEVSYLKGDGRQKVKASYV